MIDNTNDVPWCCIQSVSNLVASYTTSSLHIHVYHQWILHVFVSKLYFTTVWESPYKLELGFYTAEAGYFWYSECCHCITVSNNEGYFWYIHQWILHVFVSKLYFTTVWESPCKLVLGFYTAEAGYFWYRTPNSSRQPSPLSHVTPKFLIQRTLNEHDEGPCPMPLWYILVTSRFCHPHHVHHTG